MVRLVPDLHQLYITTTASSLVTGWHNDTDGLECLLRPPTKLIIHCFLSQEPLS